MSDILVSRPQGGKVVLKAVDGSRYLLDFETGTAMFSRNGDDLVIKFDDGSGISIAGLYKNLDASFISDGEEVRATDFLAALGDPGLVPAEGPAPVSRGRHHEWDTMTAQEGLDHLSALDSGMDSGNGSEAMGLQGAQSAIFPAAPSIIELPPEEAIVVHESALPGGSGGGELQARGALAIGQGSVASLLVNGISIPVNGTATIMPLSGGRLILSFRDGVLHYEFNLESSVDADGGLRLDLPVEAVFAGGGGAKGEIGIVIADDMPFVRPLFEESVLESDATPLAGNVLEGSHEGADGGARLFWEGTAKYGDFTATPDGSWTYVLHTKDPRVTGLERGDILYDDIPYAYVDADGSRVTGVLRIRIDGQEDAVILRAIDPSGDEGDFGSGIMIVKESGLASGTNPGKGLVATGGVDIVARVEVVGILAGDTVVPLDGMEVESAFEGGTLFLSYDGSRLSFRFELSENTSAKTGTDISVPLFVAGADGFVAEGSVRVHIADDAPVIASEIRGELMETDVSGLSGNVLEGALAGADGASLSWPETTGKYGTLSVSPDGDWSYMADPAKAASLLEGERGREEFRYEYIDGDGSVASGRLVIDVIGEDNGVRIFPGTPSEGDDDPLDPYISSGDMPVNESGLSGGTEEGTANIRAHGSVVIEAPDGLASISIGGRALDMASGAPQAFKTENGVFTVVFNAGTGVLSYTYELASPADHSSGDVTDALPVVVTNRNGTSESFAMRAVIVDDAPKDGDVIHAADEDTGTISGNIDTFMQLGADREGGTASLSGDADWIRDGKLMGSFALSPDGSYAFVPAEGARSLLAGEIASHEWLVTWKDRDGDEAQGKVTVRLSGLDSGAEITGEPVFTVPEGGTGTTRFDISSPDGIEKILVNGEEIVSSGTDIPVQGGTVHVTRDDDGLVLEFVPDGPWQHDPGADEVETKLVITAVNGSGGETTEEVVVKVLDGKPVVTQPDTETVTPDAPVTAGTLVIDPGPDIGGPGLVFENTESPYGSLVVDGNDWSFTLADNDVVRSLKAGEEVELRFPFSYTDKDGDSAPGDIVIRIIGKDDGVTFGESRVEVSEKGLPGGNGEGTVTGSGFLPVESPDGIVSLSIDGVALAKGSETAVRTPEGTLLATWTDTGISWSFTLERASASTGHDFTVVAVNGSGSSHETVIRLDIEDDGPTLGSFSSVDIMSDAEKLSYSGNVLFGAKPGADGDGPLTWIDGTGQHRLPYGTLTLEADGSWSFVLDPEKAELIPKNAVRTENVQFTYEDADGTKVYGELPIRITGAGSGIKFDADPDHVAEGDPTHVLTAESGLVDGVAESSGRMVVINNDGPLSVLTVNGEDILAGGPVSVDLGYGIFTASYADNVVTWSFTLKGAVDNAEFDPGKVVFHAEDVLGGTKDISFTMDILDHVPDTPEITEITVSEIAGTGTGNLLLPVAVDGWKDFSIVSGPETPHVELSIDGTGNISWKVVNTVGPEGAVDEFVYKAIDGDGSEVTGRIVLSVTDAAPGPGVIEGGDVSFSDTETGITMTRVVRLPDHHEPFASIALDPSAITVDGTILDWHEENGKLVGTGERGKITLSVSAIRDDGTAELSVTLDEAFAHTKSEAVIDGLAVRLEDANGSSVTFGGISITVTDAIPEGGETLVVLEEGVTRTLTGSVAGNVADAPATVSWGDPEGSAYLFPDGNIFDAEGRHIASCELHEDGSYSFSLDRAYDVVGGMPDIVIPYTLTDADGSSAAGSIRVSFSENMTVPVISLVGEDNGPAGEVPDTLQVSLDESALPNGTGNGTTKFSGKLHVDFGGEDGTIVLPSGNLVITDGKIDGPDTCVVSLSLNGSEPVSCVFTLHDNGDGTFVLDYEAELSGNTGKDAAIPKLPVVFRDATGDEKTVAIDITVNDDAPVVAGTVFEVREDASETMLPDLVAFGADNDAGFMGGAGEYGYIERKDDGTFVYVRNGKPVPAEGAEDVISVTARDGDESITEGTVTIRLVDVPPVALDAPIDIRLEESTGVYGNSGEGFILQGPESVTDAVFKDVPPTVSGLDGDYVWEVDPDPHVARIHAGDATLTLVVSVDGNGKAHVAVTCDGPLPNADNADIAISDFVITGRDAGGSQADFTGLTVTIADAAPVTSGANPRYVEGKENVQGMLSDDFGPDGKGVYELSGSPEGTYGVITLDPDGHYSYVPKPGAVIPEGGAEESFTYVAIDGDGSRTEGVIRVSVVANGPVPTLKDETHEGDTHEISIVLNEADGAPGSATAHLFEHLEGSSATMTDLVFVAGNVPTGPGGLSWTLSADGRTWTGQGADGSVSISIESISPDGVAVVSASMTGHIDHGGLSSVTVSGLAVRCTDSIGKSGVNSNISVSIADAVPAEMIFTAEVLETDDRRVLDISPVFGADGPDPSGSVNLGGEWAQGAYGRLLYEDGKFIYERNDVKVSEDKIDSLSFWVKDADGSTVKQTVDVTIRDVPSRATGEVATLEIRDVDTKGNLSAEFTASAKLFESADGFVSCRFGEISGITPNYETSTNRWEIGDKTTKLSIKEKGTDSTLTITGIDSDGTVHFRVLASNAFNHANTGGEDLEFSGFEIIAVDGQGNEIASTTSLVLKVIDDVPVAEDDTFSFHMGEDDGPFVIGSDENYSADHSNFAGKGHSMRFADENGNILVDASGNAERSFTGKYGTFTIDSYTFGGNKKAPQFNYSANAGVVPPEGGWLEDSFTYVRIDNDGSVSNVATVTMRIYPELPESISMSEAETLTYTFKAFNGPNDFVPGTARFNGRPTVSGTTPAPSQSGNYTSTITLTFSGKKLILSIVDVDAEGNLTINVSAPDGLPNKDGADILLSEIKVLAEDTAGHTVTNSHISINLTDDGPEPGLQEEVIYLTGDAFTGNLGDYDKPGIDGWKPDGAFALVGSGETENGTFVLESDGTWVYQRKPEARPADGNTESFTYTMTDADGTSVNNTITFTFRNEPRLFIGRNDAGGEDIVMLSENDFASGSANGHGKLVIEFPGLSGSVTFGDVVFTIVDGKVTQNTDSFGVGRVAFSGVRLERASGGYEIFYDYALSGVTADGSDETGMVNVGLSAPGFESVTGFVQVQVADGKPVIPETVRFVYEEDRESGDLAKELQSFGADGAGKGFGLYENGKEVAFQYGDYGYLFLNADGSYIYQLSVPVEDIPEGAMDRFIYRVYDGDGSFVESTLEVEINTATGNISFDDTNFLQLSCAEDGSIEDMGSGTITFSSPDGLGAVMLGGKVLQNGVTTDIPCGIGKLQARLDFSGGVGTVKLTFEQDGARNHSTVNAEAIRYLGERMDLVIADTAGNRRTATVDLSLFDTKASVTHFSHAGQTWYQEAVCTPELSFTIPKNGGDAYVGYAEIVINGVTAFRLSTADHMTDGTADFYLPLKVSGTHLNPGMARDTSFTFMLDGVKYEATNVNIGSSGGTFKLIMSYTDSVATSEPAVVDVKVHTWQVHTWQETIDDTDEEGFSHSYTVTRQEDIDHRDVSPWHATVGYEESLSDEVPNFENLHGNFDVGDSADGPASVLFKVEGATLAAHTATHYEFSVPATGTIPEGMLILDLAKPGNWNYRFVPKNTSVQFTEGNLVLFVLDADGSETSVDIALSRARVPVIHSADGKMGVHNFVAGSFEMDEGDVPEHGGGRQHADHGSGHFFVDLLGQDGQIAINGTDCARVLNGSVYKVASEFSNVGSFSLTVTNVVKEGSLWRVDYTWKSDSSKLLYNGNADHMDFTISARNTDGMYSDGVIRINIHDDHIVARNVGPDSYPGDDGYIDIGIIDSETGLSESKTVSGRYIDPALLGVDASPDQYYVSVLMDGYMMPELFTPGTVKSYSGRYGTFTLNHDGTFSYTYTGGLEMLPLGDTVTDSLSFSLTEKRGDSDSSEGRISVSLRGHYVEPDPEGPEPDNHMLSLMSLAPENDGDMSGNTAEDEAETGSCMFFLPDFGISVEIPGAIVEDTISLSSGSMTRSGDDWIYRPAQGVTREIVTFERSNGDGVEKDGIVIDMSGKKASAILISDAVAANDAMDEAIDLGGSEVRESSLSMSSEKNETPANEAQDTVRQPDMTSVTESLDLSIPDPETALAEEAARQIENA